MCLVGHAGNTLILLVLLQAAGIARAWGADAELVAWVLAFGMAQDLDGVTIAFRWRTYFGASIWAHRGVGHTLVGLAVLVAAFVAAHLDDGPRRIASALALLVPLHFVHVGLDVLTHSERGGIRPLWPLSGRRLPYLGRIRWYSVTVIFLMAVYAALYPLASLAGRGAVVALSLACVAAQAAFILRSTPAVAARAETWDAHERRFVPGWAYAAISRVLLPIRGYWKNAYRDATAGR